MEKFKQNIELDARLVLAGMNGGIDAIMNFGLRRRDEFPDTKSVTDRCEWLKKQSNKYITEVSKRAAELESLPLTNGKNKRTNAVVY